MNRAQRRAEVKYLQKNKGMKRNDARAMVEKYRDADIPLEEGTPVKLNYEMMKRHPDWRIQRDDFKAWVEAHKDDMFTVEWDKNRKERNSRDKKFNVCLAEDTTEPKWLFYTSTLIPMATATVKFDNEEKELKVPIKLEDASSQEKINEAIQEALDREKSVLKDTQAEN